MGEGVLDGGGGDAVVAEVDEAGALEAGEDGGGGGLLDGGVGGEEGGEVDELVGVSFFRYRVQVWATVGGLRMRDTYGNAEVVC